MADAAEAERCPICHDPLGSEEAGAAVQTECGHLFCSACLLEWLALHKRCPLCNAETKPGARSLRQLAPIDNSGLRVQDGDEEEAASRRIDELRQQRRLDEAATAQLEATAQRLVAAQNAALKCAAAAAARVNGPATCSSSAAPLAATNGMPVVAPSAVVAAGQRREDSIDVTRAHRVGSGGFEAAPDPPPAAPAEVGASAPETHGTAERVADSRQQTEEVTAPAVDLASSTLAVINGAESGALLEGTAGADEPAIQMGRASDALVAATPDENTGPSVDPIRHAPAAAAAKGALVAAGGMFSAPAPAAGGVFGGASPATPGPQAVPTIAPLATAAAPVDVAAPARRDAPPAPMAMAPVDIALPTTSFACPAPMAMTPAILRWPPRLPPTATAPVVSCAGKATDDSKPEAPAATINLPSVPPLPSAPTTPAPATTSFPSFPSLLSAPSTPAPASINLPSFPPLLSAPAPPVPASSSGLTAEQQDMIRRKREAAERRRMERARETGR